MNQCELYGQVKTNQLITQYQDTLFVLTLFYLFFQIINYKKANTGDQIIGSAMTTIKLKLTHKTNYAPSR